MAVQAHFVTLDVDANAIFGDSIEAEIVFGGLVIIVFVAMIIRCGLG